MTTPRFSVVYQLTGNETTALEKAHAICLEQTVEVNDDLVPDGFIRSHVIGQLEQLTAVTPESGAGIESYAATISYAPEITALELTQLLNVMFGNSSLKEGIRVTGLELTPDLLAHFPGPRFGIAGLRQIVQVPDKPLLCTALKPMGKTPTELAAMAYQAVLGGVDMIKDDHGLTDQPFCPFKPRVQACAEAVAQANQQAGTHCIYVPNITAPLHQIWERIDYAKNCGAGGLMIAPGLTGFDTMRAIAADPQINLPLISHPALLGSLMINPYQGISHRILFGELQRLAGADASIYPTYAGRFGFSKADCRSIVQGCQSVMGNYPSIFPTPGGGMTLDKVPDLLEFYGSQVIFLIGGALYSRSPNLVENVRYFLSLVGR